MNPIRLALPVLCAASLAGPGLAQGVMHAWEGTVAGGSYGHGLDAVGDVDGDGCDDIGVGQVEDQDTPGQAWIRSGKTGAVLYAFSGVTKYDRFGENIAGLGDTDLDGFADFAIAAPADDTAGNAAGEVRAYSGQTGTIQFTVVGLSADDYCGRGLAGAGDFGGDGTMDLVIGSPNAANGRGRARVIHGTSGQTLFTKNGSIFDDGVGYHVGGAGDTNGINGDAVMISAVGNLLAPQDAGQTWVYKSGFVTYLHHFTGANAEDDLGQGVLGLGDIDQDGFDDFGIGVPGDDTAGPTYGKIVLHSGLSGAVIRTIYGAADAHRLGSDPRVIGDWDGDGCADIADGNPYWQKDGATHGGAAVYSSATGLELLRMHNPGTSGDYYGSEVGGGDFDGDGDADLLVNAYRWGVWQGKVFVIENGACGAVTEFGAGCPGQGGVTPTLVGQGCAVSYGTLSLELKNATGGESALLVLSPAKDTLPLPGGCASYLKPAITIPLPVFGVPFPGAGGLTLQGELPPVAAPFTVHAQMFVSDPVAPAGFITTNGVTIGAVP